VTATNRSRMYFRATLCATALAVLGLVFVTGGCPVTTDPNDSNTPTDTNTPTDSNTVAGSNDGTNGTGPTVPSGGVDPQTGNPTTAGEPTPPAPVPTLVFTQIVKTGDTVPGQTGATFSGFGTPVIDASGRVAFWGKYTGTTGHGTAGVYVYDATSGTGVLKRVLDDDPTRTGIVPGQLTTTYYGPFDANDLSRDLAWAGGDRLVVTCPYSTVDSWVGVYRWRATDENMARVLDQHQLATLYGSQGFFPLTNVTVGISDAGLGVVGADYKYLASSGLVSATAIWTSNGTSISTLVDTHSDADNVPGEAAVFTKIYPQFTLNGPGDILLAGQWVNEAGTTVKGLYLGRSGQVYKVLDTVGSSWTGLTSGAQFRTSDWPSRMAIGPLSHIGVDGKLLISTVSTDAVLLWDFVNSRWYELTGPSNAAATSLVSGVNDLGQAVVLSGGNPYLTGAGVRVQLNATLPTSLQGVTVTWTDTVGAVNNNGRAVISYTHSSGSGLAFWTGTQLLVLADTVLKVPAEINGFTAVSAPRRDRPGRSGMLNDVDQMAFRAATGTSETIYLAHGE